MSILEKEMEIADLYLENEIESALPVFYSYYFTEAAYDNRTFGQRICDAINKIIEAFQNFIRDIKIRLSSIKLKRHMKKASKELLKKYKCTVRDKDKTRELKAVMKSCSDYYKKLARISAECYHGKIGIDVYSKNLDALNAEYEKQIFAIANATAEIVDSMYTESAFKSSGDVVTVGEMCDRVQKCQDMQEQCISAVDSQNKKVCEESKKEARSAESSEAAQVSGMKAKASSNFSRKVIKVLIALVGVRVAVGILNGISNKSAQRRFQKDASDAFNAFQNEQFTWQMHNAQMNQVNSMNTHMDMANQAAISNSFF